MEKYRVVGIMSGTSLDGVDVALCVFTNRNGKWKFEIECAQTISYSSEMKKKLSSLHLASALIFAEEDAEYGKFLGNLVKSFLKKNKASADFVSSHGHTVFHQPKNGFTTQLGDGASLSAACGLPVACDFRTGDVALGGQGAPLVPVGDKLLFNEYKFCLNLGGIANISFDEGDRRIAFDVCPVNMVLNFLSAQKDFDFDKGGKLAAGGKLDQPLMNKLNWSHDYYFKQSPKSLGREDVEKIFFPILKKSKASVEDKLFTFCRHVAFQIDSIFPVPYSSKDKMLVTGGGAHNSFLMKTIGEYSKFKIIVPEKRLVDFKEALIFAFLGVLRWHGEVNCLKSVTGAARDSCAGAIYRV